MLWARLAAPRWEANQAAAPCKGAAPPWEVNPDKRLFPAGERPSPLTSRRPCAWLLQGLAAASEAPNCRSRCSLQRPSRPCSSSLRGPPSVALGVLAQACSYSLESQSAQRASLQKGRVRAGLAFPAASWPQRSGLGLQLGNGRAGLPVGPCKSFCLCRCSLGRAAPTHCLATIRRVWQPSFTKIWLRLGVRLPGEAGRLPAAAGKYARLLLTLRWLGQTPAALALASFAAQSNRQERPALAKWAGPRQVGRPPRQGGQVTLGATKP